jgi:hypothetical protein
MKICDKCRWVISSDNKCGCWPLANPVPMQESKCSICGHPCIRDEVDIGVGTQYGPWQCINPECGAGVPE